MRQLYSVKAYHSTRQKGLKKFESRTTTATIDTGEGAHVHGWGLYLQADEMANRESYYDMFDKYTNRNEKILWVFGDLYNTEATEDFIPINDYNSITVYNIEHNYGKGSELSRGEELCYMFLLNGYDADSTYEYLDNAYNEMYDIELEVEERGDIVWQEIQDANSIPELYYHYSAREFDEARKIAKGLSAKDYEIEEVVPEVLEDGTHSPNVSQYTVEIPDDMVFIDEDNQVPDELVMTFVDTFVSVHTDYGYHGTDKSFYGKKNYLCKDIAEGKFSAEDVYIPNNCPKDLEELLRTRQKEFVEDLYGKRETIINNIITDNGRSFYSRVSRTLGGEEKASLWLAEHGIDGMTYEGGRDHGCFVIYNCDKLKIVAEY